MMRQFVFVALVSAGAGLVQAQRPAELVPGDHAGFESIFDGSSLKGWDGDPSFWRVENGAIIRESQADRRLTQNTFLIWRGGAPADFELKCDRITATNSGVQIPFGCRHRQVGDEGLSGGHRLPEPVHRPDLRGTRTRIPGDARTGRLRGGRRASAGHRHAGSDWPTS